MPPKPNKFFWYELMTSDMKAAAAFYSAVVGWKPTDFSGAMPYTVLNVADRGVAGIMALPEHMKSAPPSWVGYIYTPDTDATARENEAAGAKVWRAPSDIPEVGRFAVMADPQGAVYHLMTPKGPDMPELPFATPGTIGWHELYTSDLAGAVSFYCSQFGWEKGEAMPMGDMGDYQIINANGAMMAGMMKRPPNVPMSAWLFYFIVPTIDAAAAAVTANGGKVIHGPMEVPGGSWMVQCLDPQGGMFALNAPTR